MVAYFTKYTKSVSSWRPVRIKNVWSAKKAFPRFFDEEVGRKRLLRELSGKYPRMRRRILCMGIYGAMRFFRDFFLHFYMFQNGCGGVEGKIRLDGEDDLGYFFPGNTLSGHERILKNYRATRFLRDGNISFLPYTARGGMRVDCEKRSSPGAAWSWKLAGFARDGRGFPDQGVALVWNWIRRFWTGVRNVPETLNPASYHGRH